MYNIDVPTGTSYTYITVYTKRLVFHYSSATASAEKNRQEARQLPFPNINRHEKKKKKTIKKNVFAIYTVTALSNKKRQREKQRNLYLLPA